MKRIPIIVFVVLYAAGWWLISRNPVIPLVTLGSGLIAVFGSKEEPREVVRDLVATSLTIAVAAIYLREKWGVGWM